MRRELGLGGDLLAGPALAAPLGNTIDDDVQCQAMQPMPPRGTISQAGAPLGAVQVPLTPSGEAAAAAAAMVGQPIVVLGYREVGCPSGLMPAPQADGPHMLRARAQTHHIFNRPQHH